MRIYTARKRHVCARCSKRIQIGTLVTWDRHATNVYYHVECEANPVRSESHALLTALLTAIEEGKEIEVTITLPQG